MKVDRVLRALSALAGRPASTGLMELSGILDEPAPSLHRTLQVLVDHHLVIQEPATKRYRLGPGVLALADAFREQNQLVVIAQPILDAVRADLNESVFLCELVDERAVVVAVSESPRPLRYFMRPGHHMPFHVAASARVILAFQDAASIRRLLERDGAGEYTDRTRTGDDELREELDRVLRQGFAVCDQELEVGVKAVAWPIRDNSNSVVASIAVVAPQERLAGSGYANALRALSEAAAAISRGLGHRPGDVADPQSPAKTPATDESTPASARGMLAVS